MNAARGVRAYFVTIAFSAKAFCADQSAKECAEDSARFFIARSAEGKSCF